jgi:hypothetical protein
LTEYLEQPMSKRIQEFTQPLDWDEGIYRRENAALGKQCGFCGDNLPTRYWILDLARGRLFSAKVTETEQYIDAEIQLRQACCTEHAVLDLSVFLPENGIRLSPPGTASVVPCARCGVPVDRWQMHYSIWAAEIEDGEEENYECHNHGCLCRPCAEYVGDFHEADIDAAIESDDDDDPDDDGGLPLPLAA